jgi:signal transduction histidine kinase
MDVSNFLAGGGEMGALTRSYDWGSSSIGVPEQWPQSLLTTVSILLNSKFPMFLWWGEEHIQFYNDAYRPSLGNEGKHPTALGQKGKECWPEIWPTIYPLMRQVLDGGESTWQEDALIPIFRNGRMEDVYWTFSYSPVKGETGKVEGVLVVCTETTKAIEKIQISGQQVLSMKKLQETEAAANSTATRLELALAAATLGSFEYMFDTREVFCNKQCRLHLGLPLVGTVYYDDIVAAILPTDKESKEQAMDEAVRNHHTYNAEYRVSWPDGSMRWIRAAGNPVYKDNGEPLKMVGITIDITEQKLFTAELGRQVLERTLELQRSNDDLQQFAHITSHDLKEPVRKLKIWSGRLRDDAGDQLSDKGRFYLDKLQHATDRIQFMIDSILSFSSISSSNQAIEKVDLNEVISQVEADLEILIQEKKAVIHREAMPVIEGSGILLYQLFYNLINNSLKFSKKEDPPVIAITAYLHQHNNSDTVTIRVQDNGIGFDDKYRSKIFSAFTRLNSKDVYEGTGLGLALCQKVVERHGGTLSASGKENKGATFSILLPLRQTEKSLHNLLSRIEAGDMF